MQTGRGSEKEKRKAKRNVMRDGHERERNKQRKKL